MARVLVPFNMARLGKRLIGLDAFTWGFVEKRFRVVLLAQPARYLEDPRPEGGECRLPPRVGVEEQLEELRRIASMKPEPPRMPRLRLGARLAWLFLPFSAVRSLFEQEASELGVSEELQAVGLARALEEAEPLGLTEYAVFSLEEGYLSPLNPGMRRIYSALAERDPGPSRAAEEASRLCG